MAWEKTIGISGQPTAEVSSASAASAHIPRPPPPYSSGRQTPRNPFSPSAFQSSLGNSCARAFRMK
jgi:hypothetical protein